MNLLTRRGDTTFWDSFAPWYEKWLIRGTYHQPVIKDLLGMIEPGWRVLDIGAGTGVLSLPVAAPGIAVHALEPSAGMREILRTKAHGTSLKILPLRWEDYQADDSFDLIVACNSLHLTSGGIMGGMHKVFASGPSLVCLATEINQDIFIDFKQVDALQKSHEFLSIRVYRTDSSFHFTDMEEAEQLQKFLNQHFTLTQKEDKFVAADSTDIAVVWWEKKRV